MVQHRQEVKALKLPEERHRGSALMILTAVTALTLGLTPHPAPAHASCSPRDPARTREELVAIYSTFREAFMKSAPQAWIDALAPSFTLTLFDGKVMPRDWVEGYVRTNATQFRIQTLAMAVQSITRMGDTVVATVQQTSDRESRDDQGVSHRLEVGALQLESWLCTKAGWRLTSVKEHKLLYLRRDGQSSP